MIIDNETVLTQVRAAQPTSPAGQVDVLNNGNEDKQQTTKQGAKLPAAKHTEAEIKKAEQLNKIVKDIDTSLNALAAETKIEKAVLLSEFAEQLGISKEATGQAAELIELGADGEFFHSPDGTAYVTYKVKEHYETVPVESKSYSDTLCRLFYLQFGKPPNTQAISTAINYLRAKARIEGEELTVNVRIASGANGEIYYDLCNPDWQVVEITGEGWKVVDKSPVKFVRYGGMMAQTVPMGAGSIESLWAFVNVGEDDRVLVVAWLLQALRPIGPYPVLIKQGGQGTGKSLAARILRALIDPSTAPLRSLTRDRKDLMITAKNSWCLAYDNLSSLSKEESDDFCKLSTGGGISPRQLYTDTDQIIIDVQRPTILNGITSIATMPDLQERAISLLLSIIPKEKRRPEKKIWEHFNKVKPEILAALFGMVAAAIKNLPNVLDEDWPRMADFAAWIRAAESAMPFAPGTFAQRYNDNQAETVRLQAENDVLATAVCKFVLGEKDDKGQNIIVGQSWYVGTASDLLKKLEAVAEDGAINLKAWPTKRTLKDRLMRLQGVLLSLGIRYEYRGHKNKGSQHALIKVEVNTSLSSPASRTSIDEHLDGDETCDDALCNTSLNLNSDETNAGNDDIRKETSPLKPLLRRGDDISDESDNKNLALDEQDDDFAICENNNSDATNLDGV